MKVIDFQGCGLNLRSLAIIIAAIQRDGEVQVINAAKSHGGADEFMFELGAFLSEYAQQAARDKNLDDAMCKAMTEGTARA